MKIWTPIEIVYYVVNVVIFTYINEITYFSKLTGPGNRGTCPLLVTVEPPFSFFTHLSNLVDSLFPFLITRNTEFYKFICFSGN
jgi:hypothetical protein